MDTATVSDLATVAGAAAFVAIVEQLILNAWKPSTDVQDRVGPLLAVALGIVTVVGATLTIGAAGRADIVQAVVNGIIAGTTAIGFHGIVTKTVLPPA